MRRKKNGFGLDFVKKAEFFKCFVFSHSLQLISYFLQQKFRLKSNTEIRIAEVEPL